MIIKFVMYGLIGLLIEVFFTGIGSLISNDFTLIGHTYIWMFFIYGSAVFLERIHDIIRDKNFIIRGGVWSVIIFSIEFVTGFLLHKIIGVCPWDYSGNSPYTILGYIRLDYLPFWFVLGLLFEQLHDYIDNFMITLKETPK
ncbi:hypothetical protein GOQ27_15010 [Clostridium sp. D2Q-11]|uniref:ABC-transporter type IV n=1 Tax=Anaeromonas frigoriresistens TaxID=2683708 RepID=A0A942Z8G7_9FIRM|nr:hypothetical protein [Anaeromonas frigoriresistens]MBS4539782.1 hypothetical protein [Anaeromonas frigoriresistens]